MQPKSVMQYPNHFNVISHIKIVNMMGIGESNITFDSSLELRGGPDAKKSTTIACLLMGLGYDIMLQMSPERSNTLCGIDISDVVPDGVVNSGFVELTINLNRFKSLKRKHGAIVKLRREFQKGSATSDSIFTLSQMEANALWAVWTKPSEMAPNEVVEFLRKITPSFALRLMVLNSENLQLFSENFKLFDEVFWNFVDYKRKRCIVKDRELLKANLKTQYEIMSTLKASIQAEEAVTEQHGPSIVPNVISNQLATIGLGTLAIQLEYNKYEQRKTKSSPDRVEFAKTLIDSIRKHFQWFLQTQKYVGDLVLDNEGEFLIWMSESEVERRGEITCVAAEEARRIWKCLSIGKRKLAIYALYLAFWQIMDSPIVVADACSSGWYQEFPDTHYLRDSIKNKNGTSQFVMSLP